MNAPATLPTVPVTVKTVAADTVFAVLSDPTRRRILHGMSDRKPRIATAVQAFTGKSLSATIKHLKNLEKVGLLVSHPDPEDKRRQTYTLIPSILVAETPDGKKTMDFGYCVVRI